MISSSEFRWQGYCKWSSGTCRPAGCAAAGEGGGFRQAPLHGVLGDRLPPLAGAAGRSDLEALAILAQPALEPAGVRLDPARGDRQVATFALVRDELRLEMIEGPPAPGEQEKAGGVAIEPVERVERRMPDPSLALRLEQAFDETLLPFAQLGRHAQDMRLLVDHEQIPI